MKKKSIKTTIAAILIVLVIIVACISVIMKLATVQDLTALLVVIIGAISAWGFFNAKDSNASSLDKGVAEHLNSKFKKNEL